jgi:hypothetical protein
LLTSHEGEVFGRVAEVRHWLHIRLTNLTNTSQANEDLVLDDYKSVSPGRIKVRFSTKSLITIKDKIDPYFLFPKEGLASASYMAKLGSCSTYSGVGEFESLNSCSIFSC